METITLKAEPRVTSGTRTARKLRAEGKLPAIIYGHKEEPQPVILHEHEFEVAIDHGARTLQVDMGGKLQPCLIKEVQYDYLGHNPIHVDLARVDMNERVRVKVGIELRGVPKGVHEGGILEQHMASIEVECLVMEIPNTLHPVVGHLGVGDLLLVKDLTFAPGVNPVPNPEERVASVRMLVEAAAATTPAEGEEASAEPELIIRPKKEEAPEEGKA